MRLYLNKISTALLLVLFCPFSSFSQEEFLQLDSVVIVSDTLQMTINSTYNSFSIDQQLTKSLSTGQLVKVRNASLQFFNSPGQIDFTSNNIYNFGILCNGNIILDASSAVEGDIHGNGYGKPIDVRYFLSKYRAFNSKPDLFFSENLIFKMTCSGSRNITNTITYRLELVYYSYE